MNTESITELAKYCKIIGIINSKSITDNINIYTNYDHELDLKKLFNISSLNKELLNIYNKDFNINEVKDLIFRTTNNGKHKCICNVEIETLIFIKNITNKKHFIKIKYGLSDGFYLEKEQILMIGSKCIGKYFYRKCNYKKKCNIIFKDSLTKPYCKNCMKKYKEEKKLAKIKKCLYCNDKICKKNEIYCINCQQIFKKCFNLFNYNKYKLNDNIELKNDNTLEELINNKKEKILLEEILLENQRLEKIKQDEIKQERLENQKNVRRRFILL